MGADLAARREHANETIRTRLLTVNFYLEAIRWPVESVFDHRQKISRLCKPAVNPPSSRSVAAGRIKSLAKISLPPT